MGGPPRAGVRVAQRHPERRRRSTLSIPAFRIDPNWCFYIEGERRHYLVEARVDGATIARAHGWFAPGDRLILEKIEVDARMRSKGCGTALIECLRAKARDEHCGELVIRGVRAANHGAIRLYESLGARCLPRDGDLQDYLLAPP